jgi:hypothetical protein
MAGAARGKQNKKIAMYLLSFTVPISWKLLMTLSLPR